MGSPSGEAARRRTFAIISHPDAGKTTLTERLLHVGGAITEAGSVNARAGRRSATSDWMAIERARGISVTSTVLRFEREGVVFNLLDTPGHQDFSEDTYRVLSAADAAIMLIDAAKGVEEQTRKLFEVARRRRMPTITVVNKVDRPGLSPLELLDDIERTTGMQACPVTWPVGPIGWVEGLVDRRRGAFQRAERAGNQLVSGGRAPLGETAQDTGAWAAALDEIALLDEVGAHADREPFVGGDATPVFFASAVSGFGVDDVLDAVAELVPSPGARADVEGSMRPLDAPFSAFVFKIQANLDPRHRDRIAFLRICSGTFEAGMRALNARSGRSLSLAHAHEIFGRERTSIAEAYPGDVVGVSGATDLWIGDTLYVDEPVVFPRLPTFVPEIFARARLTDTSRYKQFKRGLALLDEEGVVQVLRFGERGDQEPILAGAGALQFDVAVHRLANEFGSPVVLEPMGGRVARATVTPVPDALRLARGVQLVERSDGTSLALFESDFQLRLFEDRNPAVELATVV